MIRLRQRINSEIATFNSSKSFFKHLRNPDISKRVCMLKGEKELLGTKRLLNERHCLLHESLYSTWKHPRAWLLKKRAASFDVEVMSPETPNRLGSFSLSLQDPMAASGLPLARAGKDRARDGRSHASHLPGCCSTRNQLVPTNQQMSRQPFEPPVPRARVADTQSRCKLFAVRLMIRLTASEKARFGDSSKTRRADPGPRMWEGDCRGPSCHPVARIRAVNIEGLRRSRLPCCPCELASAWEREIAYGIAWLGDFNLCMSMEPGLRHLAADAGANGLNGDAARNWMGQGRVIVEAAIGMELVAADLQALIESNRAWSWSRIIGLVCTGGEDRGVGRSMNGEDVS